MKLCFATNNAHKLEEVRSMLAEGVSILSLFEAGCVEELPENQKTLEGNSLEKAEYVFKRYNVNCFADDTGLEVFALDGAPGVYSARYARKHQSPLNNTDFLLQSMKEKTNRKAQFRTVISLIIDGKLKQFEGVVKGQITEKKLGSGGFGYDAIFQPDGHEQTFAEMSMSEKNAISHRGIALQKLIAYLSKKAE